ncbi:helix-hairpin-helix domain-containing protein [Streptomyces sp. B-S-A8]|uniref:Helix-hairpin-helix domain-containing protein n=1 Tax=Streptomyces solicavernae TaxID=3043614 RepID=A0ABT6S0R3_9ACTN|nr:helix-hairpin-helix domain-containing protein [Streptomyces sp. B-S-A8]MDI3390276.1 helix-hairpin-helix domain-containing protein [Streptomyces sp. B-S-A8]
MSTESAATDETGSTAPEPAAEDALTRTASPEAAAEGAEGSEGSEGAEGAEGTADQRSDAEAEGEPSEAGARPAEEGTRPSESGAQPAEEPAQASESGAQPAEEPAQAPESGVQPAEDAAQPSEAEAELAAQQELRERIERRKAEREAPIESGTKLSGTAADLLAAVRAVESGEKPARTVFEPEAPPRRPAPEPVRRPEPPTPSAPAGPVGPAAETVDAVRAVLAGGGAPAALAEPTATALGEGADAVLREDPWQLLRVAGVRPEQADGFARALLGDACRPDDARRNRAVAVWLLEQAAVAGHTALDAPALESTLGRYGVADADAAVQSAIAEGDLLVFQDALETAPGAPAAAVADTGAGAGAGEEADEEREQPVRVLVGLERYALAEESLADGLARVLNSPAKEESPQQATLLAAAGSARGSTAELIRAVGGSSLVLHTGGEAARAEPAALVAAAAAAGLRVCAAAHTPYGKRAFTQALATRPGPAAPESGAPESDVPGAPESGVPGAPESGVPGAAESDVPGAAAAVTVAGLLSGAEGPGRDAEGAFDLDLLVLLDAPQLDVEGAAMLVESLPDGARLVLSGDPGVLWSAGPGRVFADLVAARVCPVVVSRVPDEGPIGELVSGVGVGELNQVAAPEKEVVIVPVRDAGEAVHRTVQLVAESVPRAFGLPVDATQVITVGHGGAAGTRALNAALKERLNPGPGRFGGFDPGDRVAYSPAPGRTVQGRVVRADADGLHLECEGGPVVVRKERVEQSVRHGWALTAHQAVGQRWPAAVVVLPGDAAQGLTRAWVYTAFGRAERHLSVVHGVEQALPRAVAERPAKPRTTRLQTLLRTQTPPQGTTTTTGGQP